MCSPGRCSPGRGNHSASFQYNQIIQAVQFQFRMLIENWNGLPLCIQDPPTDQRWIHSRLVKHLEHISNFSYYKSKKFANQYLWCFLQQPCSFHILSFNFRIYFLPWKMCLCAQVTGNKHFPNRVLCSRKLWLLHPPLERHYKIYYSDEKHQLPWEKTWMIFLSQQENLIVVIILKAEEKLS